MSENLKGLRDESHAGIKRHRLHNAINEEPAEGSKTFRTLPIGNAKSEEAALSNFLILKQIFSHLSYQDKVTCCKVNETWMSVADPMIVHYQITFTTARPSSRDLHTLNRSRWLEIEVDEIRGQKGAAGTRKTNIKGLLEILRGCGRKYLMSIDLRIINRRGNTFLPEMEIYIPFLSEFGDKICSFQCENSYKSIQLWRYYRHLSYMPNLEVLKSDKLVLGRKGVLGYEETPRLPQLRKIQFSDSAGFGRWNDLLCMAPNVTKIFGLPLEFAQLLNRVKKAHVVKSIVGFQPYQEKELNISRLTARLAQLAELDLALTSVTVPRCYVTSCPFRPDFYFRHNKFISWGHEKNTAKKIRTHFQRILESSKDSARVISIASTTCMDYFFPVPFQMVAVRVLSFDDDWAYMGQKTMRGGRVQPKGDGHYYFPPGTDLNEMFPNLEGIEMKFMKRDSVNGFPEDTFGPGALGPRVRKLKTSIAITSFKEIAGRFPHVSHLEMHTSLCHFTTAFGNVVASWPKLETLTLLIDSSRGLHKRSNKMYYNFDSVLTGIPQSTIDAYKSSGGSTVTKKQIPVNKIRKFQSNHPSLLSLRNLRRLEFIVEGSDLLCTICSNSRGGHISALITPLAADFALKYLPNLKVFLRMNMNHCDFQEVKDSLLPVSEYIEFENKYSHPELPFQ